MFVRSCLNFQVSVLYNRINHIIIVFRNIIQKLKIWMIRKPKSMFLRILIMLMLGQVKNNFGIMALISKLNSRTILMINQNKLYNGYKNYLEKPLKCGQNQTDLQFRLDWPTILQRNSLIMMGKKNMVTYFLTPSVSFHPMERILHLRISVEML